MPGVEEIKVQRNAWQSSLRIGIGRPKLMNEGGTVE